MPILHLQTQTSNYKSLKVLPQRAYGVPTKKLSKCIIHFDSL